MVTKIMEWVSMTALLLVVSWRPVASYQIPLDLVVCRGALVGVLALFFVKREMETHYDVENRPDLRLTLLEIWCNFSRIESSCCFWKVGVTVVIQFGSTDPVVRFQWIVHGVGHLAMQLQ